MKKLLMQAIALAVLTVASFAQTASQTTTIQGLPPGLTLSTAGIVSGTPAAGSQGTYQFNVQACDSEVPPLCSAETPITILVVGPVIITNTAVPPAVVSVPYSQPIGATGGVPPYTWGSQ